jgi:ligand-binding sensor domain-containing protein
VRRRLVSHRRTALIIFAAIAVSFLIYFAASLANASRSLRRAQHDVARETQLAYRSVRLDRPISTGFEPVSSPAQFRDAALLNGRLFLCGPSGLLEYAVDGKLHKHFRPGLELPAAPLVAIASAPGAGWSSQQLWIATAGAGLLRFDGAAFEQILPANAAARSLTSVLPLASGRILLGTEKAGVLVWDGKALTELHPSLAGFHVTALAGSEADLWIGALDRGALRWHAGQLDRFTESSGLPDAQVLSLAVDGPTAFVGTALGAAEFRDGRFTRVLAPGIFAQTLLVHADTLHIGTLEEGIVDVALAAAKSRPRARILASAEGAITRLVELNNRIYALTENALYQRRPDGALEPALDRTVQPSQLTDRNISALAFDRAGRLWVGYFDRGLDILEPSLDRARHIEDDRVFCVNRIVTEDERGVTAVATANGLSLFDASAQLRQTLTKSDGLIANHVTDVLLRAEGKNVAITAATPAGVTTIDDAGTSSLYAFHGLVNNHAYALAASGSRILVGTLGGLSILDSGVVTASYTTANSGLKHNWITAIARVDADWFLGTYGAGILKLDSAGRWSAFADLKSPVEINPNAMLVTSRAVYAGTLGQGLAVFNRASERWARITTGLPSANITALAAGGGYIYIGTDNGLSRVPETEVPLP